MKKTIKVIAVILFSGFSFFYTEKVTKIIRKKDPIMIKLNEAKKDSYVSVVKPIINDDEYIDQIFSEFNSLSIVYRKPEEKFAKYIPDDIHEEEEETQRDSGIFP